MSKTRDQIKARITADFPDNTTGEIGEADLRGVATDLAEAAIFPEDVPTWARGRPLLVICTGQSNAAGSNSGGPNPADARVKVWDGVAGAWGSSDYTQAPFSRSTPHGNAGNNNMGLAFAHRMAADWDRPVYLVYDAVGGTSIDEWVATGPASARYAALKAKVEAALATPEWAGITTPEVVLIWAQGEEDYQIDFATHLANLETLVAQFRAETWFPAATPILMAEMSPLHNRYPPQAAIRRMGTAGDAWVVSVTSGGLALEDSSHWTGDALWEFGYHRMYAAYFSAPRPYTVPDPVFLTRLGEPAGDGDAIVVCKFDSLISAQADQNNVSTGTIAWGFEVAVDGNYSVGFGYQTTVANLANYSFVSGRDCHLTDPADYAFATGYQVTVEAKYAAGFGRGHTVAEEGGIAFGKFSEYTTPQDDPVLFQIGIGTSSSNRANAITARASGAIQIGDMEVHASQAEAAAAGLLPGQLYRTSGGTVRIVI